MNAAEASDLLGLSRSNAPLALLRGRELLIQLDEADHRNRAVVHRAMSVASRYASTMEESVEMGRRSVAEANMTGDVALRAETMTTLAGSLAIAGDKDDALAVLTVAAEFAPRSALATIEFQRGTIYSTRGDVALALDAFSAALVVFEEMGDEVQFAWTLHNRGLLRVLNGDLAAAEQDLTLARDLHVKHGQDTWLGGAEHSLGVLAAHRGDIPAALRRFSASEDVYRRQTGSSVPIHSGRCEVLLSAGLFREALALATTIYEEHRRQGRGEDEAEARLVAAQAALLSGELDQASALAGAAAEMFIEQGRNRWAADARRVSIQARYQGGTADTHLLQSARDIADSLEGVFSIPASQARLTAGFIALDLGEVDAAAVDLAKVGMLRSGPVELRLQSRLARARLRLAREDERGADAAARSGMRLLEEYQAALGASDIRSGVERHAEVLASVGLQLAIESGRPRRAFSWMELTHAPSLRYRPVVPSGDKEQTGRLAQLRKLTADLRDADEAAAAALTRQMKDLQRSIRDTSREARGSEAAVGHARTAELVMALGDRTLVEFAALQGTLWAVAIRNGRFSLREIAPESEVLAETQSLRFIMRRLARGRGSTESAVAVAQRLDDLLFGSLQLGDVPLVVVPTPALHALPWWALPTCRGRPVTISPSTELWYRASRRVASGKGTLVTAGPDLEVSDLEVRAVGRVHPGAKVLSSKRSEVGTVLANLEGAGLAHIASHAFFQFENPMFSSLRLADGDLNVYDIERLGTPPDVVVLSACDSGFTDTHAGEELTGLSSALLSMGTRSIIASVGLVPDSKATKDLMVALHRGLVAGLVPSIALHRAQTAVGETPEGYIAASSFICIGAS